MDVGCRLSTRHPFVFGIETKSTLLRFPGKVEIYRDILIDRGDNIKGTPSWRGRRVETKGSLSVHNNVVREGSSGRHTFRVVESPTKDDIC